MPIDAFSIMHLCYKMNPKQVICWYAKVGTSTFIFFFGTRDTWATKKKRGPLWNKRHMGHEKPNRGPKHAHGRRKKKTWPFVEQEKHGPRKTKSWHKRHMGDEIFSWPNRHMGGEMESDAHVDTGPQISFAVL